jgi:hypothetical protein
VKADGPGFRGLAIGVVAYAMAMGYLEGTVVVYLQHALRIQPGALFPLQDPVSLTPLGGLEIGRELATLVMLVAVGWLVGRSGLERLAWVSVAFGVWDLSYYAWLWLFIGWPPSLGTFDLLFLVPVPWVGPVLAPMLVSLALVAFGLLAARRLRHGGRLRLGPARLALGIAGGLVVIVSFMLDAGRILAGGPPAAFAWPVFGLGMALGLLAAVSALWPQRVRPVASVPGPA